jgi:hypothetical protein
MRSASMRDGKQHGVVRALPAVLERRQRLLCAGCFPPRGTREDAQYYLVEHLSGETAHEHASAVHGIAGGLPPPRGGALASGPRGGKTGY